MPHHDRHERFSAEILAAYESPGLPELFAVKPSTDPAIPSEILIYEEIGANGIRAKDLAVALAKVPSNSRLKLRINSPGGSAWDGLAMHNMLRERGNVDAVIDGLAASAASVIAMAADNIAMHESASMMIHNSHGLVIGNRHDMVAMQGQLASMDDKMRVIYADRTGKTVDDVGAMMDAETWFASSRALAEGFADAVVPAPERKPRAELTSMFEIMALARDIDEALAPIEKLPIGPDEQSGLEDLVDEFLEEIEANIAAEDQLELEQQRRQRRLRLAETRR